MYDIMLWNSSIDIMWNPYYYELIMTSWGTKNQLQLPLESNFNLHQKITHWVVKHVSYSFGLDEHLWIFFGSTGTVYLYLQQVYSKRKGNWYKCTSNHCFCPKQPFLSQNWDKWIKCDMVMVAPSLVGFCVYQLFQDYLRGLLKNYFKIRW